MGFGAVAVRYAGEAYFSKSASASILKDGLVSKSFAVDSVSRKRIWRGPFINEHIYDPLHRIFAENYWGKRGLRTLFNTLMELRGRVKIQTEFIDTEPKGRVTTTFNLISKGVQVEVDLRGLDRRGCEEILILNEQAATTFRRYFDSSGLKLVNEEIGAWDRVEADEATLSDLQGGHSFTVKNLPPATLYRGGEYVKGRLDWAGLNYSLKPDASTFTYSIELGGSLL